MVIIAFYRGSRLLKTNIIKSGERGPIYIFNRMIRDKKVFFPTHKNIVRIGEGLVIKRIRVERLYVLIKRTKFALKIFNIINIFSKKIINTYPMLLIYVFIRIPFSRKERIFLTDDLTVKKSRKFGKFIC